MTFREYWRALGFGAFSTKARCYVDQRLESDVHLRETIEHYFAGNKILMSQLDASVKEHHEFLKSISDRALQKAGIRPVYEKPPQMNNKLQPVGSFAEMDVEYDRIQAADRRAAGVTDDEN